MDQDNHTDHDGHDHSSDQPPSLPLFLCLVIIVYLPIALLMSLTIASPVTAISSSTSILVTSAWLYFHFFLRSPKPAFFDPSPSNTAGLGNGGVLPDVRVTSLHCFPVKSCRAVDLAEADVSRGGFEHDREYMIVKPSKVNGEPAAIVTGRMYSALCALQPSFDGKGR